MSNDYKKLYKKTDDKKIAGVCGGIGDYLNVDPTIVRVIWVLCTFASLGTGVLAYIIAALIMPEEY